MWPRCGLRPGGIALVRFISVRLIFLFSVSVAAAGGALFAADPAPPENRAAAPLLRLDEPRLVELALEKTLSIKLGLLQREGDRFALRVARQQLHPRLNFVASSGQTRTTTRLDDLDPLQVDDRETTAYGPQVAWKIPTGGEFSYNWNTSLGVGRESADDVAGDRATTLDTGWTVSFSQPLLRGGGWTVGRAGVKQAEIVDKISQLNLRATVIGAINEVLAAYRTYIRAKEAVSIAKLSLERGQQTLDVSRDLLGAGRVSRSELTQAEADVAGRELAYITAVNGEDAARLRLGRLLDQPSDVQFETQVPAKVERVTAQLATALELAYRSRTDFAASQLDGEAAKLGLAVAKNAQFWDLRLAATHSQTGLHTTTSSFQTAFDGLKRPDKRENFIGLTLNLPIWGDLERRQTLLSAKLAVRQHALRHENLRHDIEAQVIDRIRNLEAAWKTLELARLSRELAAKAVDDESFRFRSGLSSMLNVARLEDGFVNAQNGELGALLGYLNAVSALDETLGTTLPNWKVAIETERGEAPRLSP